MTIAERYAEGRVGALLDEEQLTQSVRAPNWEPLRLAGVAVLTTGAAIGAHQIGVPDALTPYVVGGSGVLTLILLYGSRVRAGLDILDAVRGVQRP